MLILPQIKPATATVQRANASNHGNSLEFHLVSSYPEWESPQCPDIEDNSACTSGSRCNSSISSGMTRRCSERRDLFERFDLVDFVDLALLTLFRVDWRSRRFLEMVLWRFLLLDEAAIVVTHGCFRACWDVILSFMSRINNLSMKSLASGETSFQCWNEIKILDYA